MRDSALDAAQEKPEKSFKKNFVASRAPSPCFFPFQMDSSEELPETDQLYEDQSAVFKEDSDSGESSSESAVLDDTISCVERSVSSGSLKSMLVSTPPLSFAPQKPDQSKMGTNSPLFAFSPPGSSKKCDEETAENLSRFAYTL